jgi:hypothetical protein
MWIGMHAAHGTCFVPTPCGVTALAEGLTLGNASLVDRRSSWWAHRYVLNVARGLRFDQALEDIRNEQLEWERRGAGVLKEMERLFAEQSEQSETDAAPGASDEANIARITGAAARHADAARDAWWRLADALMAKFADGFVSRTQNDGSTTPGVAEGYPDWWLDAAGFADGPPPPPEPPRNGRGPGIVGGEETRAAAAASALGRRGIADA